MLLFYVDESYDENIGFHLGILASGEQVAELESALDELVSDAYHGGVCDDLAAELHGKDLVDRKRDWKQAGVKDTADVYEKALTILASVPVEVIPRGIRLRPFKTKYAGRDYMDPYQIGFENLTERLNERLLEREELALVIADRQDEHMERLRRHLDFGKRTSTGGGYRRQQLTQIIDTVHFVDSHESRMIQLADLAAYVVRRRQVKNLETDGRTEAVMGRLIELVLRRIPPGKKWWYTANPVAHDIILPRVTGYSTRSGSQPMKLPRSPPSFVSPEWSRIGPTGGLLRSQHGSAGFPSPAR